VPRYHNKTGLSDAIGVGCAVTYATRWLGGQLPAGAVVHLPLDLEYDLGTAPITLPGHARSVRVALQRHAKRRPDYLLIGESAGHVHLMVVECKGSSGRPDTSLGQLGDAMHQLAALEFTATTGLGPSIDRHAYAARLTPSGGKVELYGVDPGDDGEPWIALGRPEDPERAIATVGRGGHVVVADAAAFAAAAMHCVDLRAAAWTGVDPADDAPVVGGSDEQFADIIGTSSIFALPNGRRVEIVTGALAEVVELARTADPAAAAERREAIARRLVQADERLASDMVVPFRRDDTGGREVSAITSTGLILALRVSGRQR
jgi:hypothetical protein